MKYSVIIPVRNGKRYLKECLDSVAGQAYRDFEAIIVDDGSTDGSGDICDMYARADSRFRVIHAKHGGVSAARNTALETAHGEYVVFADCDDVLSPMLLECAENYIGEADVLLFGYTHKPHLLCTAAVGHNRLPIQSAEAALNTVYLSSASRQSINYGTVWAKVYRRTILEGVRFPVGITVGEDRLFNFAAYNAARSAAYCDAAAYMCRFRSDSVMHGFAEGYVDVAEQSFALFEKILPNEGREQYEKALSLRAVAVLRNIAVLELCNKRNPDEYKVRRAKWQSAVSSGRVGKYFSICDGEGLGADDGFFAHMFKKPFFRINLMLKFKPLMAAEYLLYKAVK